MDPQEVVLPVNGEVGQEDEKPRSLKNLEEYAHMLEMKLTMKSTLLDEAVHLQQGLSSRLTVLEHGLTWKDAELQAMSRQSDEACKSALIWQQCAERLEE